MEPSGKTVRDFLNEEFLAPSILPSIELAKWGQDLNFCPRILGEILFRFVCYRGNLPEELEKFLKKDEFKEPHSQISAYLGSNRDQSIFDRTPLEESEIGGFPDSVDYFNTRLSGIQKGHGLIALWISKCDEALAVPFVIEEDWGCEKKGFYEGGAKPRKLTEWQDELTPINSVLRKSISMICLRMPLGPFIEQTHGKSLHLPINLAIEASSDLSAPTKEGYLATGEIKGGKLDGVRGIKAKSRLAKWMGLTFIAQESGESENCILFNQGDCPSTLIEKWKDVLGADPESMSPSESYNMLRRYESRVICRKIECNPKAIETLTGILRNLELDEDYRKDGWRVDVCLGNFYNHMGMGEEATEHLTKALSAVGDSPSGLLVSALASLTVTKTHSGLLLESEQLGLEAKNKCEALDLERPERIRAKLEAWGSLGAQPLLHQGIWDQEKRDESEKLLKGCVSQARQLIEIVPASDWLEKERAYNQWAHSHGQLAWWKALFKPREFLLSYDKFRNELASQGKDLFQSQSCYLLRARWHAVFRIALREDMELKEDWLEWDLPAPAQGHEKWLLALCLKYRGLLYAINGSLEKAREDFSQAKKILTKLCVPSHNPNVHHLLRGSVFALQYAYLDDDSAKSSAIEEFEAIRKAGFYYAHPKASPSHWLEFLKGKTSRNPQLDFVY